MARRRLPRFDRRWLIGLAVVVAVVLVVRALPERVPDPTLHLVALGPEGTFHDTLDVPAAWRDNTGDEVRVPLVLGVRSAGERAARPERLTLSLPAQYRLSDAEGRLVPSLEAGSPLVRYVVEPGLGPVQPERLPALLPALDTVWLEVILPAVHCVTLGDSVPEFIPAPPPPVSTLRDVRIFFSFEGGDLRQRRTGTLTVRLDSALLDVEMPPPPPSYPVVVDTAPVEVGPMRFVGSRMAECGEPQNPRPMRSTLWRTETGGRVILLGQGGTVRKRLYDLDGDGVVERESWDADGDGTFESTRRAELPIPEFLLPLAAATDTTG